MHRAIRSSSVAASSSSVADPPADAAVLFSSLTFFGLLSAEALASFLRLRPAAAEDDAFR